MNDREMLKFAAKASNIFITRNRFEQECTSPWDETWEPEFNEETKSITGWRTWYGSDGEIGGWEKFEWQPIKDDGEALRLAVKLNLWEVVRKAHRLLGAPDCPDMYAATRHAIVRAAAEIGKAMP